MRRINLLSLSFILLSSFSCFAQQTIIEKDKGTPFAVVELFTAEGCSSCPQADSYLRKLIKRASDDNQRIYGLSMHVDYWNALGWVDPFSDPFFTARQRTYAQALNEVRVYTPQVVVNGTAAMVGSRSDLIEKSISYFLAQQPATKIHLAVQRQSKSQVQLSFKADPFLPDMVMHIALAEQSLTSFAKSGENAGQILYHDNVVRFFRSFPLQKEEGAFNFSLQPSWKEKNLVIIVFLQKAPNTQIVAANSVHIPQ